MSSTRTALLLALAFAVSMAVVACSERDHIDDKLGYEQLYNATMKENLKLRELRKHEQAMEDKGAPPAPPMEPIVPSYNPLEEVPVSITMRDESLHDVLFIIARNAGLNLVIEPGVSLEENRVTISFESARSSDVIESLLDAYDLTWSVKNNVLYVKRFQEKTFDIGFLNVKSSMDISSGGDIFGTVDTESGGSNDLSGRVTTTASLGKGLEDGSLYAMLAANVDNIINNTSSSFGDSGGESEAEEGVDNGYFTLDPTAGTLHVRTSPSKVEAVAALLRTLQRKLRRQVVIDARIMEVELSDNFRFGIDWNYVTTRIINGITYNVNVGWNGSDDSPVITIPNNYITKSDSLSGDVPPGTSLLNATVDALSTFGGVKVISNPHVRARHGQPTLFTSGVSQKYVDSIEREVDEGTTNPIVTYSIETATVFDGVILGVLPYINDDGSVDIQVFPIKSSVEPGSLELVDVTGNEDRISLPKVNVKNVSASVRLRNGGTIILGGLIDKNNTQADKQVPGLGDVPLLGWLFKSKSREESARELVIIMDIKVVQ